MAQWRMEWLRRAGKNKEPNVHAMKHYPRLFERLFCSHLMLHEPTRCSFESSLLGQMIGAQPEFEAASPITRNASLGQPSSGSYDRDFDDMADWEKGYTEHRERMRVERIYKKIGSVAVIKIHGVIDKLISQFEMDCYGGLDLADVDIALSDAASDPAIKNVVLYINSPGGSVTGTPETASRVAALSKVKRVTSFVPTMACSAGYYIASQANRIVAAPSAIIGSIGVYMAILDASAAYKKDGLEIQLIKSGKYKAMGAPFKPLTEEETAMLKAQSDSIFKEFRGAITAKRPRVSSDTMEGQWFDGTMADNLYLVDELSAETLDEFVSRLLLSR